MLLKIGVFIPDELSDLGETGADPRKYLNLEKKNDEHLGVKE